MDAYELKEKELDLIITNNIPNLNGVEDTKDNRDIIKLYVRMNLNGEFNPRTIREAAKVLAERGDLTLEVVEPSTEQINTWTFAAFNAERTQGNDFAFTQPNVDRVLEYVRTRYENNLCQATITAATQYLRAELQRTQPVVVPPPPRQKSPRELERLQPGQLSMYATLDELARPEVTVAQLKDRWKRRLAAGLPRD